MKNIKGTLLISILISIGIISILATFSFPYLQNFSKNIELSAVARDLATDLKYAQQLTITEQITYGIEFDILGSNYKILKIDSATTTVKTINLPLDISFQTVSFTNNLVRYNSYGAVFESGNIILENISGITKEIIVKPSGYVQTNI